MLNLQRWQTIAVIAFTALAALFALPNVLPGRVLEALPSWYAQSRINLGLDLRGGAHFLLEADLRSVLNERLTNLSDSVRGELRKNQVAFKEINIQGGTSVVVVLRDEAQRPKALEAIRNVDPSLSVAGNGDTIQLGYAPQDLFRKKKEVIDQSIEILRRRVDETGTIEPTIVRQGDDRILLQVPGIKDTTDLKRKINQRDNAIISAPAVQSAICGGSGIITGQFTTQQTQEQALLLRTGALPATLTIIEERPVGADLGADAIHAGTVAAIVGTVLVMLFMFVTYGPLFGGFANLAMSVNMLLVFAGMSVLGASLTLPGIAGLVLTVGMSVDSNVLIYERVREERNNGRSAFSALATGYDRALTAVIDSNLTALIAGVLLFGFGSGPIRGFATSLSLGLLTHLFTATIFTRMLLAVWVRWRRPTELVI